MTGGGGRSRPDDPGSGDPSAPPAVSTGVERALERARTLGVLGPVPIAEHLEHSRGFLRCLADVPNGALVLDLGSGGGIPGLAVGEWRPDLRLVLLDALDRRCRLLEEAVSDLGWTDRVQVLHGRAEELGRDPHWRERVDVVIVRSFGPPATVAECAAPFLKLGGRLVVSEPPDRPDRWPEAGLEGLGLRLGESPLPGFTVIDAVDACPPEFPRRVGLPAKRPLFR